MTSKTQSEVAVIDNYMALTVGSDFAEVVAANIGNATIQPFDLDRVKIPAGGGTTWEVPTLDGVTEVKEIDGVIIHWRKVRAYWTQGFDESGGGTPPDCSSEDGMTGVGDPGGSCAECPLSKFGSDANHRAQACKEMRMLFLIREGDRLPLVVSIPPSSLGSVSKYFLRLVSHGIPYFGAITRLTLEKNKNKDGIQFSQASLSLMSELNSDQIIRVKSYADGLRPLFSATPIEVPF